MTIYQIESGVPLPSKARDAFDKSCKDVDRLLEIHEHLGGKEKGRRYQLEVLNKSAIVLITAIWEAYCEDITSEAIEHIVKESPNAQALTEEIRKSVAKELKRDNHDLAVWGLADDGWRSVLRARLEKMQTERARNWNTPKAANVKSLFSETLGIDITAGWNWKGMSSQQARTKLDYYVNLRGEIAHRAKASECSKSHVEDFLNHVQRLVKNTGQYVSNQVKGITGTTPW